MLKNRIIIILIIMIFGFAITGCGETKQSSTDGCTVEELMKPADQRNCRPNTNRSNSSSSTSNNRNNTQKSCTHGWIEDGKCCRPTATGQYVDENGECYNSGGATVYPGYEIPVAVNNNGCFTVHCTAMN